MEPKVFIEKLDNFQDMINKRKAAIDKLEGREQEALSRLKEFNVFTIEEAEKLKMDLENKKKQLENEMNLILNELEENLG